MYDSVYYYFFLFFSFCFLAFKLGLGFLVIMSAICNLSIIILLLCSHPFECRSMGAISTEKRIRAQIIMNFGSMGWGLVSARCILRR